MSSSPKLQVALLPPVDSLPVTDISIWVEKFSVLAAILVTRFPEKAAELFAYQASIVRAERNYEGNHWVVYDRQYRWEALARKDLNWSMPDSRLYNEAFLDVPIVCRRITSLRLAHAIQTAPCLAGSQNCHGGQVQLTQPHALRLSSANSRLSPVE